MYAHAREYLLQIKWEHNCTYVSRFFPKSESKFFLHERLLSISTYLKRSIQSIRSKEAHDCCQLFHVRNAVVRRLLGTPTWSALKQGPPPRQGTSPNPQAQLGGLNRLLKELGSAGRGRGLLERKWSVAVNNASGSLHCSRRPFVLTC